MRVVLLHSLPLDASMWSSGADLGIEHPVAPTLYGLGATLEEWARGVVDLAGPDPFVVIGNSVGGSCALEVAALVPERVRAIVLIGAKADHRPEPELRDEAIRVLIEGGMAAAWPRYWAPRFGRHAPAAVIERARTIANDQAVDDVIRGVAAFHGRRDLGASRAGVGQAARRRERRPGPHTVTDDRDPARRGGSPRGVPRDRGLRALREPGATGAARRDPRGSPRGRLGYRPPRIRGSARRATAMKALRVVRHGPPAEALEIADIPVPEPGAGEVRIAVSAASVNFGDIARCRGTLASVMGQTPFTLGMDVCGVVTATGEGADEWHGRRVVALTTMAFGGIADHAIAPISSVFDAPPEIDDIEAAAFTIPFHVGWLALHQRARLQPGESLLVIGGASAVGTAVIQLGIAAGARVIAVAGGPEKTAACESLGAVAIDHKAEDVFDRVLELTDTRGADVVVDLVGGDQTETIWACVAREGRYLPVGFNADAESGMTGRPLRKVAMGNFSVLGVMLAYTEMPVELRRFGINTFGPETGRAVHAALLDLAAAGAITPFVGRRISMEQVASTLEDHEARRTMGRTVVDLRLRA